MSRHYMALRSRLAQGDVFSSIDEILDKLALTDPNTAKILRSINWAEIIEEVAQEAIKAVEIKCKCSASNEYGAEDYREQSRSTSFGKCLGSLHPPNCTAPELGIFIAENKIRLVWDDEEYRYHRETLDEYIQAFERAYIETAMATAVLLVSQDSHMKRTELKDGSIAFEAEIKERA